MLLWEEHPCDIQGSGEALRTGPLPVKVVRTAVSLTLHERLRSICFVCKAGLALVYKREREVVSPPSFWGGKFLIHSYI